MLNDIINFYATQYLLGISKQLQDYFGFYPYINVDISFYFFSLTYFRVYDAILMFGDFLPAHREIYFPGPGPNLDLPGPL